jgi:glutathione peroxidase
LARPIIAAVSIALLAGAASAAPQGACPKVLDRAFPSLQDGAQQSLCQYGGKVVMVVNTASFCGYTRQYEALEAIYEKYRDRGLAVIGFPSNDFGQQEPGSDQQIAAFCRSTYGIKFPMFGKTSVVGPQANALFDDLAQRTGARPKWNFHKYLIDRRGEVVKSFGSSVEPDSKLVIAEIERLLANQ